MIESAGTVKPEAVLRTSREEKITLVVEVPTSIPTLSNSLSNRFPPRPHTKNA